MSVSPSYRTEPSQSTFEVAGGVLALTGLQKTGLTGKGREHQPRESLPCNTRRLFVADREPDLCPENGAPPLLSIPLDDATFLRVWDDDIKRAVRAATNGNSADEEDFAQQIRARLLMVNRAFRDAPTPYIRVVIVNTLRSALRREDRSFSARSRVTQELNDDLEAPTDGPEDGLAAIVSVWVRCLPERLRDVYRYLYAEERSQREAARLMRVSQPRIAQLHQRLIERGREELAHLAV